ncbi:cysteine desulfurase family protein [uncultured Sphingomonas sp.]|uniref:cysteine desulfurase family protein n=1 Tax=uncultured Sphingomonas sp. TaxID=158754 RepID=UPI0035CC0BAC
MTYLDYQATTPLAPEALAAMIPWLRDGHANPHSPHREGRRARAAVEVARDRVAALLPRGGRVAFTSGATEALNWAIKGTTGPIVTVATEHAAVLDTVAAEAALGRTVTVLPVRADGLIDLEAARTAIVPGTGLVAAMLVNNEIGVVQPIAALADIAQAAGAAMLCDAVQGYGRMPVPEGCDLVAISAHKVYGPKGIGALWVRHGVELAPLMHGGGQEAPGRSGTLSPALCAGFGVAAALMRDRQSADMSAVDRMWQAALGRLGPIWMVNGSIEARYHGNLNIRRDGLDVNRLMSLCRDIAFSAGSACASGSGRSSHVLRAIGLTETEARTSVRIGFGRYTTPADLGAAMEMIAAAADAQRRGA